MHQSIIQYWESPSKSADIPAFVGSSYGWIPCIQRFLGIHLDFAQQKEHHTFNPVRNIWAADTLPSVDHRLDNFVYDQVWVEPSIETILVKRETFPLVGVNIKHVGSQHSDFVSAMICQHICALYNDSCFSKHDIGVFSSSKNSVKVETMILGETKLLNELASY